MTLPHPLSEWLPDVLDDPLVICGNPQVESVQNMWSFSLSTEEASQLHTQDILDFLQNILDVRRAQVLTQCLPHDAIFYAWFDEIAGRLCLSVIASPIEKLAFAGDIKIVTRLEPIIEAFLSSPYLEGIPKNELTGSSMSASETTEDDVSASPIPVYQELIPHVIG